MEGRDIALRTAYETLATATRELQTFCGLAASAAVEDDADPTLHELSGSAQSAITALEDLTSALGAHTPASGVFASMPADALAEIFRAWTVSDIYGPSHRGRAIPCAFTAAAVNRHWRAVATSTPSIWAKVTVDFAPADGVEDYLKLVLSRSKAHPLDIQLLNAPSGAIRRKLSVESDILVQLVLGAARIEVRMEYSRRASFDFDAAILALLQADLPLLDSLEVHCPSGVSIPAGTHLLTSAPNLRRLSCGSIPMNAFQLDTLANIVSFSTAANITTADFEALCSQCRSLTALDLDGISGAGGRATFALPRLEYLRCSNGSVISQLGEVNKVPRLRELDIRCRADVHNAMTAFLSAPCVSLHSLTLRFDNSRGSIALRTFLSLLPSLPNLRVLRLHDFDIDCDELKTFFTSWNDAATLAQPPHLETLELQQCSSSPHGTNSLVRFLALRRPQGTPISRVVIAQRGTLHWNASIFPIWMVPRLKQLVDSVEIDVATAVIGPPPDV